jgi:hypothetical protein
VFVGLLADDPVVDRGLYRGAGRTALVFIDTVCRFVVSMGWAKALLRAEAVRLVNRPSP